MEEERFKDVLKAGFAVGMTQEQFSSRFGVTVPTVGRWKLDDAIPGQYLRKEIADYVTGFLDRYDFAGFIDQAHKAGLDFRQLQDELGLSSVSLIERWRTGRSKPHSSLMPVIINKIGELLETPFSFPAFIENAVAQGLEPETLSQEFGVSAGTIGRWRAGKSQPAGLAIPFIVGKINQLLKKEPSP